MPLISNKRLAKKVTIRGKRGKGIVDTATMALISTGLPWEKILASIGAATYSTLGALALKKIFDRTIKTPEQPPAIMSAPIPQGTLKGDMVQVKEAGITRIDPQNHMVDLPEDLVKTTEGIKKLKIPKTGKGVRPKRAPKNINNLLNEKSKDILKGLKSGKGIFQI